MLKAKLSHSAWLAAYAAAEARDSHIAAGRHWRAAAACLAVALLRTFQRGA